MSDFDDFESAGGQVEEDPAAEFLKREQNELAGLDDDEFIGGQEQPPALDNSGADAFGATQQSATVDQFDSMMDQFGGAEQINAMEADMQALQMGGEDFGGLGAEQSLGGEAGAPQESQNAYAAISSVDKQRSEPEKIKKWRENQKIQLELKDAEDEKKREQWREEAKKELSDWYKHREEQHQKNMKNNREGEAEFIHERDEDTPGHEWEHVCRLCDFNPKASRNTKDVSRMRSILLQLKQTPMERK